MADAAKVASVDVANIAKIYGIAVANINKISEVVLAVAPEVLLDDDFSDRSDSTTIVGTSPALIGVGTWQKDTADNDVESYTTTPPEIRAIDISPGTTNRLVRCFFDIGEADHEAIFNCDHGQALSSTDQRSCVAYTDANNQIKAYITSTGNTLFLREADGGVGTELDTTAVSPSITANETYTMEMSIVGGVATATIVEKSATVSAATPVTGTGVGKEFLSQSAANASFGLCSTTRIRAGEIGSLI